MHARTCISTAPPPRIRELPSVVARTRTRTRTRMPWAIEYEYELRARRRPCCRQGTPAAAAQHSASRGRRSRGQARRQYRTCRPEGGVHVRYCGSAGLL
ncbi:MAG: hypothetical protein HZA54_10785 [Planctomycetes bacterium]|nr:hypothetical protein [Planctomycetota bacterium]